MIPKGEHWAIIETSSITIPGDERSRTNPGHGYPEHSVEQIEYRAFKTKEEFEARLSTYTESYRIRNIVGIHVTETFTVVPTTKVVRN
jgi:hypothetical protein